MLAAMNRFSLMAILLVCGFCLGGSVRAEVGSGSPQAKVFRVMTYNIWNVFDNKNQLENGVRWIKEQDVDVLALQELTNVKPEFLGSIAKRWGHEYSALLKTSGYSVGLTSRTPIEIRDKRLKGMHHGYLHASTANLEVFVVHLSPFKYEVRTREAEILVEQIKPLLEQKKRVIVMGDFNALSPSDRLFLDKNEEALKAASETDTKHAHVQNLKDGKFDYGVMAHFLNAGLHDVVDKQLPLNAVDRVTCPTGIFADKKTVPANGQRVDFILVSPNLYHRISKSFIPRDEILNRISDHYPVSVEFKSN
ncbi:Exonuclease III [Rubritalea squalenifaciens DSM 18772]|uniref:Exonuclease III n=2 Tax=Rubritalea squalenifaciens TaxID=407226 RepID=A0A1M6LUG7_9BACT|nr:Exonuclease III [Rubritalea squalenifaciens DSM 18772]